MKRRITLKLALTVEEGTTINHLIERFGMPTDGIVHRNYKLVKDKNYVVENGEHISYATEL